MRQLFLFLLSSILLVNVQAQKISGFIKDANGNALKAATVSLLSAKDSAVIKFAVSDNVGQYNFSNVAAGRYLVSTALIGYNNLYSTAFDVATADVNLPDIKMTMLATELKAVVITSQKPMVEVKAEKMILNVEGTINATGTDALELLRKAPGVAIDKDENINLSGKNGVQIYVDGKPSPLSGQNLSSYLKTLNASQIEAIEIISNPSAKYEAAGNAGIINIRLKKNKTLGVNGSVNAGWNIGTYAKYTGGLNLNYRNKKMNLFGSYNYNQGLTEAIIGIHRTVGDTLFNQKSLITNNNNSHSFKAGMDYFINKKNTIGVMVNGTLSDPSINNKSTTPITVISTGLVDRILVADNSSALKRNNVNVNLNYNYTDTSGRSLVINADHGSYDINSNQFQPNYYFDPTGQTNISRQVYQMIAPTNIYINSLKADWEQPFKKGTLGFGGKYGFVKTDNDFQRYNVFNSGKELDKDRSNRFEYNEKISAAYVNYNRAFKGFTVQAGLRVEHTNADGVSTGLKAGANGYETYTEGFDRGYTDFFPSAAVTFNKNPMSQFSVTYSRRIDRPNYQDLNPFEFKLDEYTFQKGNVNLRPQYSNSIGITHTYKYKLNTTLNYSHVSDLFAQVFDTAEVSKAFISKRNLASQDIVSLNVSYPVRYKAYSMFANLNSFYTHYIANFGAGRTINVNAGGVNLYAQNSVKFAKTWTAELTGFYSSPTVFMGTIKAKAMWSIDAGLQKQVLQGRATVKASVSDIFHTLKFNGTSDFAGQKTITTSNWESRQFKISFAYRFGSNQVKAARQRSSGADDEMKRVQQTGGAATGL